MSGVNVFKQCRTLEHALNIYWND